jgi:hypothetical protein
VGYGYQFWRGRHDTYRGDGAFGQYCVVFPKHDAVLAINSGLRDMQAVLDHVWTHLLPAFQPAPLFDDPAALERLRAKLASLSLPRPSGKAASSLAAKISGQRYALEQNELGLRGVSLELYDDRAVLTAHDDRGDHPVGIGLDEWEAGRSSLRGGIEEGIAAIGAWTGEDTFTAHLCFTESEFAAIVRLSFPGDELRLEIDPNVSWTEPEGVAIKGDAM